MGSYGRSHKKDVPRKLALSLNYHWSLHQGQFRVLGCIMGSYGKSHKKDVLRPYSGGTARHHHWPRSGREGGSIAGFQEGIDFLRLGGREEGEGLGHAEQPLRRNGGLSLFCFDIIYCNKLEALPIILCRLQCVLLHCLKYKIKKGN
uniref:Uncharacterized protein n=1 Tax=Triticum urartu TaxID=4572 RepID=A0A8R7V6A0_TRIUA